MSRLISALDSESGSMYQEGENDHAEYKLNNDDLVQVFFQLVRTSDINQKKNLKILINNIINGEDNKLKKLLFKMTGHVRDIISGKGEYEFYYMMIMCWYSYNTNLAKFLIEKMVYLKNKEGEYIHPYGSWKDIKYFCNYCLKETNDKSHPLINHCVNLIKQQLIEDVLLTRQQQDGAINISLAGKWCPREGSKFGWLFNKISREYFSKYIETACDPTCHGKMNRYELACKKAKMDLRKTLSFLNKTLDTVQIKQCGNNWEDIDHNKTTSITIKKQTKAFQNITKDGKTRSINYDRIMCADNFKNYIENKSKNNRTVKGKRVSIYDFVKAAVEECQTNIDIETINMQWNDNRLQNSELDKFFVMVDTSYSMTVEKNMPLYNAIGLGIRIAEMSKLGKKVMTFSNKPTWVNLENINTFYEMVNHVREAEWGQNTNIYAAFERILSVIKSKNIEKSEVGDMALVILSDMQMDNNLKTSKDVLFNEIKDLYNNAGYDDFPHLIFWNLRSTTGFPASKTDKNCTMVSGCNPAMINMFCEKGINELKNLTPYKFIKDMLSNDRYDCLEEEFNKII